MFFFFPLLGYYLISADYTQYPELTLKEKSELVINNFCQELNNYNKMKQKQIAIPIPNGNNYIIFWRNLPRTNIDDNTEDTLFRKMCESYANTKNSLGMIYIKDMNVLADGSIEKFIQRICLLYKYCPNKPTFLDKTTDALLTPPSVSGNLDNLRTVAQGIATASLEYENLIGFLENLYTTIKNETIDSTECGFIYYYFEWQKGNIKVKDLLEKLDFSSKRTFYLHVDEFESHPYYPEYCKIYFNDLIDKEKKGPRSIDWQEYYDAVNPLFAGKPINEYSIYSINVDAICAKYNIPTTLDVYRTWLTAKRKLKIK